MDRFTYSSAPQRKVKLLQFGVLDADFLVSSGSTFRSTIAVFKRARLFSLLIAAECGSVAKATARPEF
jgi:hypothetical protein